MSAREDRQVLRLRRRRARRCARAEPRDEPLPGRALGLKPRQKLASSGDIDPPSATRSTIADQRSSSRRASSPRSSLLMRSSAAATG
ncbi:MAG: hypothetical protein IPK80_00180 [Nannocystis sp.]|nr:hypothetical protein [Nannocystis sp.]